MKPYSIMILYEKRKGKKWIITIQQAVGYVEALTKALCSLEIEGAKIRQIEIRELRY